MEFTPERSRLVEKIFDAALKEKINELARKYDPVLVFKLWMRIAKNGCIKPYFCKWRWKPDMTINESLDCLDDYFNGLEDLLRKHQAAKEPKQPKYKEPEGVPERTARAAI